MLVYLDMGKQKQNPNNNNKKEVASLTTTKYHDIKECTLNILVLFHFNNVSAVRGFLQLFTLISKPISIFSPLRFLYF